MCGYWFTWHSELPGDVRVVSDSRMAEQVWEPLGNQDSDLLDRAAQFQDAYIQTGLSPLGAVSVEGQFLLQVERNR